MTNLSDEILHWYDLNARVMPWRVSPESKKQGHRPDPYHVWLSEVMLQQTTVAAVASYFIKFIKTWPTIFDLANARDDDVMAAWAGLGYYARARNLLKCARMVVSSHDGVFPSTQEALQKLPGIGPYTSAAIASIAFDQAATVVDGNVERVMSRLNLVTTPLPTAKPQLVEAASKLTPKLRPGDYAQAVMDLGATICTPKKPACGICPWRTPCKGRKEGIAEKLPMKLPKAPKPIRHGAAYVAYSSAGQLLLETRPNKGLLGGMLAWPTTEWVEGNPSDAPPVLANWVLLDEQVRHTFTHFHLILSVLVGTDVTNQPTRGQFVSISDFEPNDLPTVMRKVWKLAQTRDDSSGLAPTKI